MRDQQTNPAHLTAHGNGRSRDQRRCNNKQHPGLFDVDAAGTSLVITQGKDVQPPAQQIDDDDSSNDKWAANQDLLVTGTGKAAHEPVGDLRQLVLRIGSIFQQRTQCVEQRGCNRTGQHQINHRTPITLACDFQSKTDGNQAKDQGDELRFQNTARQDNSKNCTHTGAAGYTQNIRCGKRIGE